MPPALAPARIAVIADAHFHDISGDYGLSQAVALRPLAEVARNPRAFNETGFALRYALDEVVARGIGLVVLLGDYSDDGQMTALAGLGGVLTEYRARHGLRFFAVPGNHDVFADVGRHRGRRFLNAGGGYDLVTSDPDRHDPAAGLVVVWPGMRCLGAPEAVQRLPDLGFFRREGDLHWETPFGASDAVDARQFTIRSSDGATGRQMMDLSYLVEPEPGLWLLMIDANVFVPFDLAERGGHQDDYADSTDAGWQAMLRHKPFILPWMQDVARRAALQGKRLLTFSHYPMLDACPAARVDAAAVFGAVPMVRRAPGPEVARAVLNTGIKVAFSGHLHQNDTALHRADGQFVVNVGVPSLGAFPGCWKTVTMDDQRVTVETISTGSMPMPDVVRQAYRFEQSLKDIGAERLIAADSYGVFLAEHAAHLVVRRHLRREWPAEMVPLVMQSTLADLVGEADLAGITVLTLVQDWYRVQAGGEFGVALIPPARMQAYRRVARLLLASGGEPTAFARLFRMFEAFLARLPSDRFAIDLATGDVEPF